MPTIDAHKLNPDTALSFIMAGNAHFTFRHSCSKMHLTYKVRLPKRMPGDTRPPVAFVSVPDPAGPYGYSYLGTIRAGSVVNGSEWKPTFVHSHKSIISAGDQRAVAFKYVFGKLVDGSLGSTQCKRGKPGCKVEVWHEGKCCKCGKRLTVPESIESGMGPECRGER